MVDDSDDPAPGTAQTRSKSKLKYMALLQDVANRMRDEILIDLNDVEAVSREHGKGNWLNLTANSTRKQRLMTSTTTSWSNRLSAMHTTTSRYSHGQSTSAYRSRLEN